MNRPVTTRRLVLFPSQQDAVNYAKMLGEPFWTGPALIAAGNGLELRLVVVRNDDDLRKLSELDFQSADTSRLSLDLATKVWGMIRAA